MEFWDVHTHHEKRYAIINILSVTDFHPVEGYWYSVGIHPWYAADVNSEIWRKIEEIIYHPQVIAIGEIGLDKLRGPDLVIQTKVFQKQIELAEKVRKPLILHVVRSTNEVIQLKKKIHSDVKWIIHGFRGNANMTDELIKHGFYISFGEKYVEEALRQTPLERLFIETDDSEMDISSIYKYISANFILSAEELERQIIKNIRNVFFTR